ncbi:MAG: ATP-binding domain-containing protein [Clostridia bacterium]|nr:ATP-binding domain-containing protein [Clostridia bacterium]
MDQWEEAYLSRVNEKLDADISRLTGETKTESRSIREATRDYMAENPFASVYGRSDEFMRETDKRIAGIVDMERRVRILRDMKKAPYFGRVDFLYDGDDEDEKIYIGISTLMDENTGEIFIYDWRAPVCSLFYNGETGPSSYEAPMGTITGEITRIRQYDFKNGKLLGSWDADLRIDDAVLRQVLSGAAGDRMKPIVCTIQREQNKAIRFDRNRDLCVFGPAGSGKTSVGVHRLSWIMYEMRMAGYTPRVLMFTANEAFRSYVSGVLPELGEDDLDTVDFMTLFETHLPGYAFDSGVDQSEALLSKDEARISNVSAVYAKPFVRFVQEKLSAAAPHFRDVRLYGETIVSADDLTSRYVGLPAGVNAKKRLETVAEWAESEIRNHFLIRRKEIENRLLTDDEDGASYTLLYRQLLDNSVNRAKQMVLDAVKSEPVSLYLRYFREFYGRGALVDALQMRVQERQLWFEDGVMMLYIAAVLGRAVPAATPSNVLIDEAQDLAYLQHLTVRALFPRAVFTVLADLNQGILPEVNVATEEELMTAYGADVLRLGKSYRATKELGEYAKRFLPEENRDYETFDRSGDAPFIIKTKNKAKTAAEILSSLPDEVKSVGILLQTVKKAKAFYSKLSPLFPELGSVFTADDRIKKRVTVMPASLAKGLEFDCVILPEADALEDDRAVAYLLVTRALHRLYLLYSE